MAVIKFVVFLIGAVLACCESAFVDTFTKKCSHNDGNCLKDTLQNAMKVIGKDGAPEIGIPRLDPIQLENINVFLLNMINITLVDGVAKGIKNSEINKFNVNIEEGRASIELTADITVKGHYQVFADSPLIKTFLGGEKVHGDGNGKVQLEKLKLFFDFFFNVVKRGDDYFIDCKFDKTKYSYNIGKMTFAADNLFLGKEESSEKIIKLMNENWMLIAKAAGNQFMDKAVEYVYDFLKKVFIKCPTSIYIIEDLEPYAQLS